MKSDIQNMTPVEIAQSWDGHFHFNKAQNATEFSDEKHGLRSPQIGALHSIIAHLECGEDENGIIVMPTGTGKTETMLSFMVAHQCIRTLVVVPSDALRSQIAKKYGTLGILKNIGVVDKETNLPKVKAITGLKPFSDWKAIMEQNVIVTTMASVAKLEENIVRKLASEIDFLIIDEAHHSKADTWSNFISFFPGRKVLLFTATPFRNDGKRLDGKILFNYSLRKAQEEGYYKPIKFHPIVKYNKDDGDMAIAEEATKILREDLKKGFDHIMMARCKDHKRAEEVFKIYEQYADLNPVLIHSGTPKKNEIMARINSREHKIVVCVNMLGEGYDLPQLKIAAIHDERQSLPIALQFIGRFTRTASNLGDASFVTNIAYAPISQELNQLYQQDADWNFLLPRISDGRTSEERKINDFMREFKGSLTKEISIDDIRPALSAEVYSTTSRTTNWGNWEKGLPGIKQYQYKRWASTMDMLVVVLGHTSMVDWGTVGNMENLGWDLIVVYFDARNRRIYLNSTMGIRGERFLDAIFGNAIKVDGDKVFRIFHDIRRLMFTTVGARLPHGKDISFQSFVGSSVQDGLSDVTRGKLVKNNFFGIGYRDGDKCSLGCSRKGKVWSRERANLFKFKRWCDEMGSLLVNESIDPDSIFKGTLKSSLIKLYPNIRPVNFDWAPEIYDGGALLLQYGNVFVSFEDCTVSIDAENSDERYMFFTIANDSFTIRAKSSLKTSGAFYELLSPMDKPVYFVRGNVSEGIDDFFNHFIPAIFYADGSVLYGNHLVDSPINTPKFEINDLQVEDWTGVTLSKESQWSKKHELQQDSIQYVFSKKIWDRHQLIIDDDGAGEIADLIGFDESEDGIEITLYHLKFALGGKPSGDINNLYQVCGQAVKSIRWKYTMSRRIFDSILKRDESKQSSGRASSILKGTQENVLRFREQALNSRLLKFHVVIVQPGLSKEKCSEEILILLGNVKQFLLDVSAIDLKVICSK